MRHRSLRPAAAGIFGVALIAAVAAASPAEAAGEGFGLDDFQVETGQDLLDICTLDQSHPSHWEAQAFCYGYFQGGADFHHAMASVPQFQPIACPTEEVTVRAAVDAFVAHARANPEHLAERPMDLIFRAVSETWPCS
ncbi:MAG TPA: Rap1a/Tai family immunity protein [Geminicoccaceae bacterium]|nr:Rap1a/Tai family immunity protein [Geminicoccaceae bacterium]